MGKTEEVKEIEILTPEQIERLPDSVHENVVFLTENVRPQELVVLNPLVSELLGMRDDLSRLKLEKDKDGKIKKESIQAYKDLKAKQRSFNGGLTKTAKKLQKPYQDINKGLIAIKNTFKEESDKVKEAAEKIFAEYEEEKKRKAEEAQAKKDAELKAAMNEANEQAEAEREKRERSEAYNTLKYVKITEGIGERAENAVKEQNEDALSITHAEIAVMDLSSLIKGVSNNHLLTEEQKEDIKIHLQKTKARAIKLIEDRFDQFEEEREKLREQARQEAVVPPPPARNEDASPADPDVATGSVPDDENADSFMKIDIQRTTPERHAEKVLNYVQGLHMSVKLRIEEEGPHPALLELMERFNKFYS